MLLVLAIFLSSVLAASIVLLSAAAVRAKNYADNKVPVPGLPMVPNPHFLLGHLRTFFSSAGFESNQLRLCVDHANDDGLSTFWLLGRPVLSVTRPSDARRVLTAAHNRHPSPLQERHGRRFIGRRSIVNLRGREWRHYRAAMHRAFTPAALAGMRRSMAEVPATLVASLARRIQEESDETETSTDDERAITLDVEPLLKMVTMDTFGRAALNLDFGCCSDLSPSPVAEAFDFLSTELMRRFRTFYRPSSHFYGLPTRTNRRHWKESRLIRGVLEEAIRTRMDDGVEGEGGCEQSSLSSSSTSCKKDDLLSNLLRAKANEADALNAPDDKRSKSNSLSEETLSDMLMTLLFAGYETTSVTLTYVLYCLANNPEAEARVLEEVSRVLGPSPSRSKGCGNGEGSLPQQQQTEEEIDPETLPYCHAVVLETLRLYPPATNAARTLESPLEVGGCTIPTGAMVFIPIWLIQRDGRNYPQPLEFVPERWVCPDGCGGWRERHAREESDGSVDGGVRGGGRKNVCNNVEAETIGEPAGGNDPGRPTRSAIPAANRDAFFAFSGGARSCVGRKFAIQEAVTILAVLVRDLKFECVDGYVLEPHRPGIVQKPRGGMPMRITRRR